VGATHCNKELKKEERKEPHTSKSRRKQQGEQGGPRDRFSADQGRKRMSETGKRIPPKNLEERPDSDY